MKSAHWVFLKGAQPIMWLYRRVILQRRTEKEFYQNSESVNWTDSVIFN